MEGDFIESYMEAVFDASNSSSKVQLETVKNFMVALFDMLDRDTTSSQKDTIDSLNWTIKSMALGFLLVIALIGVAWYYDRRSIKKAICSVCGNGSSKCCNN